MNSAISGPVSSPPKRSAVGSRSPSPSCSSTAASSGIAPLRILGDQLRPREVVLDRLLPCGAVTAVVVDQQVGGNRHQPGAGAGPIGVEPAPGAQGALEGELGQVFGIPARAHPVAEEPVDLPDVLPVELCDLLPRGAPC